MAHHGEDGGEVDAQIGRDGSIGGQMAEQPPAKADGHDALEHIAHRREGSGFLPKVRSMLVIPAAPEPWVRTSSWYRYLLTRMPVSTLPSR